MKHLKFTKMNGAGNDFVVIDGFDPDNKKFLQKLVEEGVAPDFAKKICQRHNGVGADGLFFLISPEDKTNNIRWEFWNADGSRPEMCANAARCAFKFALENNRCSAEAKLETTFGVIKGHVQKNGYVEIEISGYKVINPEKQLKLGAGYTEAAVEGFWVDTGVPHYVVNQKDFEPRGTTKLLSTQIRNHPELTERGANVTWVDEIAPGEVRAISFERGVEDFTLACGTGAVAAALSYHHDTGHSSVGVTMPGGRLIVEIKEQKALLSGPAEIVYVGEMKIGEYS